MGAIAGGIALLVIHGAVFFYSPADRRPSLLWIVSMILVLTMLGNHFWLFLFAW